MYLNEFPNFQTKSKKRVESRQICEKKYLLSIYSAQNSNWTLEFNVSSFYLTCNRWFNEVSCFLHSTIFWLNKPSACLRLHGIKMITSLTMQSNCTGYFSTTLLINRVEFNIERVFITSVCLNISKIWKHLAKNCVLCNWTWSRTYKMLLLTFNIKKLLLCLSDKTYRISTPTFSQRFLKNIFTVFPQFLCYNSKPIELYINLKFPQAFFVKIYIYLIF